MANDYQIQRAFQDLGALYAAEHHEGDDQGVQQVQALMGMLRRFKQHEDQEHPQGQSVREGTYQLSDGRKVYFDDGKESLRDAADLYEVVPELDKNGSPNLENLQARHIMDRAQTGLGLSEDHIGTLRRLMNKHAKKILQLRKKRGDHPDWLHVDPATPESTIIKPGEVF